jgi:glycosyltransferase involved in cell wall biosynthesis
MLRIQLLRAADAFILPSLVEGLSLSLLEAMACGTACLATDAGADGEVLEDGAGIVLQTQGVTAQLKTLLPLLRDHPEITELLGRKARERVLERYTFAENMVQLERLYEALLARQPHAANLNTYSYLLE